MCRYIKNAIFSISDDALFHKSDYAYEEFVSIGDIVLTVSSRIWVSTTPPAASLPFSLSLSVRTASELGIACIHDINARL